MLQNSNFPYGLPFFCSQTSSPFLPILRQALEVSFLRFQFYEGCKTHNALGNNFSPEISPEMEGQGERCQQQSPLAVRSDRLEEHQHASDMEIKSKTVCDEFILPKGKQTPDSTVESSQPSLNVKILNEREKRRENFKKNKSSILRTRKGKIIQKRSHPTLKEKLRTKPHKIPSFFLGEAQMASPFKGRELIEKREDLLARKVDHWVVQSKSRRRSRELAYLFS